MLIDHSCVLSVIGIPVGDQPSFDVETLIAGEGIDIVSHSRTQRAPLIMPLQSAESLLEANMGKQVGFVG
jgi:hypothetical protein